MRKIIIITLLSCLWGPNLVAQHINDPTLNDDFARHVKSVEEFVNRFNGTEAYPGLDNKTKDFREQNLYSLFDVEMPNRMKNISKAFVSSVINNNVELSFCDTTWFASAECEVKYKGKNYKINLTLLPECEGKRKWWSFLGIRGVLDGILPKSTPSKILPMEHETEFMELSSIFNNDLSNIMGYCSKDCQLDELTAFLVLAQAGIIKFSHVNCLKIIFLQVPDYAFTIETVGRRGRNSGWLITVISELPDIAKRSYINKLIGK